MKLAKLRCTSPSGPLIETRTRSEGGASWHVLKSSSSVRTTIFTSLGLRLWEVTVTVVIRSPIRPSLSKPQDTFPQVHDMRAALLLEDLPHGAVLRRGNGEPEARRAPLRHQHEDDLGGVEKRHPVDVLVAQEPRVRPDPVLVESEVDPGRKRHHEDEVEGHHRLAVDMMEGPLEHPVQDGEEGA